MIATVAFASAVLFFIAFWRIGVVRIATTAFSTAQAAVDAMRDPALGDDAREAAVQRASLRLMGGFASILLRSIAALAIAFAPIYLADLLGVAQIEDVLMFLARWDVILAAIAIYCAAYLAKERFWPRR
jgi:hypothetical protein